MTYLIIDSAQRPNLNQPSHNFNCLLQDKIKVPSNEPIKSVDLVSVNMPATFYNIDSGRDSVLSNGSSGLPLNILPTDAGDQTISSGYYNVDEFATALDTALTAAGLTLTVVYNDITHKYDFTVVAGTPVVLEFSRGGVFEEMGMLPEDFTITGDFSSQVAVNLGKPDHVFIGIGELKTYGIQNTRAPSAVGRNPDMGFCIPINASRGEQILYSYSADHNAAQQVHVHGGLSHSATLSVKITDLENRLLSLNNANWSMVLKIN